MVMDIKIALTATPLCGMWDKEHATNIFRSNL